MALNHMCVVYPDDSIDLVISSPLITRVDLVPP